MNADSRWEKDIVFCADYMIALFKKSNEVDNFFIFFWSYKCQVEFGFVFPLMREEKNEEIS